MRKKFYVIGMAQEVIMAQVPGEESCDMVDGTMDVYHLYLKDLETNDIYDFSFWTDDGWCGSGYTTASWGCYEFTKCVNKHIPMMFNYVYAKPDKTVLLDVDSDGELLADLDKDVWGDVTHVYDSFGNPIISVNDDGGDSYYPCGGISIDETYFRKVRGTDEVQRKVFIFTGPSGIGKSYLTANLIGENDDDLFDTDEQEIKKDTTITATYIVIGQKRPYPIDDVVKHIYDHEFTDIVVVSMEKY